MKSALDRYGIAAFMLPKSYLKSFLPKDPKENAQGSMASFVVVGSVLATAFIYAGLIPKSDDLSGEIDGILDDDGDLKAARDLRLERQAELRKIEKINPANDRKPAEVDESIFIRMKKVLSIDVRPKATPSASVLTPSAQPTATTEKTTGPIYSGGILVPSSSIHRTKHVFEGFPGAEGISKNGKYTEDEAKTIRYLKAINANTSAFSSSGMSPRVANKIRQAARKHGVNPEALLRTALYESGGNPNAISSTGAIGIFQLTGATGTALGVKNRFDEDQNIDGGALLMKENARYGLGDSPEALYYIHQLGPAAAKELMAASEGTKISDLSARTKKILSQNAGGKSSVTVGDYRAYTRNSMDTRYNSYLKTSSAEAVPKVATQSTSVYMPEKVDVTSAIVTKVDIKPKAGASRPENEFSMSSSQSDKPVMRYENIVMSNGIPLGF